MPKVLSDIGSALLRTTRFLAKNRLGLVGLFIICVFLLVGIFAPFLAPYEPQQKQYNTGGKVERLSPPSWKHWMGTTLYGRDIFSQVILGTRNALTVGVLTALFVALIGMNIGLIAGYFGGWVDNLLMRITDIIYGIPILPFAIVALAILTRNLFYIILIMACLFWCSTARVIRSQVLSIKVRPYIDVARTSGASHLRIIYKHIAPNVLSLTLVQGAFAVAWGITTETSISFLGIGDPNALSWGSILYDAYSSNVMYRAWWWFLPPGCCIMLVVMGFYFIGRAYEEIANPRLKGI